jgi:small conductance mechanosensitive channel
MMAPMKQRSLGIAALAIAVSALAAPRMTAAQGGDAGPDGGGAAGTNANANLDAGADTDTGVDAGVDADEPIEAASDATRVVRIRQVITLDQERLTWLRGELRSRKRWFEELASMLENLDADRAEKNAALDALGAEPGEESEQAAALQRELDELDEDFALLEKQTDLALGAEKIIREQIEALESKLEKERHALGRLTGEIQAEVVAPETPPAGARPQPGDRPTQPPTPLPLPARTGDTPGTPAVPSVPTKRTAAQLEAQQVLEEAERELELAEQELSEFVERKQALQQQIEFEKQVTENDAKERQNLTQALALMSARLEKHREQNLPTEQLRQSEQRNQRIEKILEEADRAGAARKEYAASLEERVAHLEEAELRITADVDEARAAEERARSRVTWLASPLHPRNVADWGKERGPRILLVIVVAVLLLLFVQLSARRIARAVVRRRRGDRGPGTGRADTLAFSFRSVSRVLIVIFGALLVLQEAGVDVKTVLGGAAILGVAVAFGAQDLMKDYFSGLLILLEDQYQLGDLVTMSGITGTVESVNMRVTVLRDLEGRVHFIPNGNIDQVTNRTYAWGRPVFEVPVRFDEDVDKVMQVLVEIANELRDDPDWKGKIIGEPDMLGVDKFTEYGVVIKFMVKTQPDALFPVRRQMLRRIHKRFNELGIQITVPQRLIVRDGWDGDSL